MRDLDAQDDIATYPQTRVKLERLVDLITAKHHAEYMANIRQEEMA